MVLPRVIILTFVIVILIPVTGCKKNEPSDSVLVTTDGIDLFAEGIWVFKGTIVSMGNEGIISHGFFWSESQNPETDGIVIDLGPGTGAGTFSSIVYDCLQAKTYYIKAFAKAGTAFYYGETLSFATPDTFRRPVIDIDHNIYYPVRIGSQVWMDKNLQATRYPHGTSIPKVEDPATWFSFSLYSQAYCWYNNFGAIGAVYGGLYSWPAAMNIASENDIGPGRIQGVCPDGWHLPGDDEWKELEMYLGMSQADADGEEWRGYNEGGKLKVTGTDLWQVPNTGATNGSRFSAFPAGYRDGGGSFRDLGLTARFWSASKRGDYALIRQLDYNSSRIFRGTSGLYEGHSVRCIRDSV